MDDQQLQGMPPADDQNVNPTPDPAAPAPAPTDPVQPPAEPVVPEAPAPVAEPFGPAPEAPAPADENAATQPPAENNDGLGGDVPPAAGSL